MYQSTSPPHAPLRHPSSLNYQDGYHTAAAAAADRTGPAAATGSAAPAAATEPAAATAAAA